jgi:hypothetical protein
VRFFFWREVIPEPHYQRRLTATKQAAKMRDPHFRVTMNNRTGFSFIRRPSNLLGYKAVFKVRQESMQHMTQVTKLMIQDPDLGFKFLTNIYKMTRKTLTVSKTGSCRPF